MADKATGFLQKTPSWVLNLWTDPEGFILCLMGQLIRPSLRLGSGCSANWLNFSYENGFINHTFFPLLFSYRERSNLIRLHSGTSSFGTKNQRSTWYKQISGTSSICFDITLFLKQLQAVRTADMVLCGRGSCQIKWLELGVEHKEHDGQKTYKAEEINMK